MNIMKYKVPLIFLFFSALLFPMGSQSKNGFDLSRSLIDVNEIYRGGPPRDGIPSIDDPKFISVREVDYLRDDDIVIGLTRNGTARAYPTRILIWHEIVNDTIEGDPVAVTYCPLCGTSMVFSRRAGGRIREFGVSGLLYQSDVLMYDRESESLWSQLEMKGVTGSQAGNSLTWLVSEHMTWKSWREKYPGGEVLSLDTGFSRNYSANAYAGYFATDATMFPVPNARDELRNKAEVVGVIINGKAKAYPLDSLPSGRTINDNVGGKAIRINFDRESKYPVVTDSRGDDIPYVVAFWFAWQAFYPDTALWDF